MKRIVIVEDEPLTRIGILSCLDWTAYGYEIAGQAANGIEALSVIRDTHPDIVITDIRMPKMDGLELIKAVKQQFPNMKIIVLSCLNEVAYVKSAMKLGADDYILKLSIEADSLLEVLNQVSKQIESEAHDGKAHENKALERSDAVVPSRRDDYVLKEHLFRKLIAASMKPVDFTREMAALGTAIDRYTYAVICCGVDQTSANVAENRRDDKYLLKYSFLNILTEILNVYDQPEIYEITEGEFIILLRQPAAHVLGKQGISASLSRINRSLIKYLNFSVSFGVDLGRTPVETVRAAYIRAGTALEHKFYLGAASQVFTDEAGSFASKEPFFSNEDSLALHSVLESFEAGEAGRWIDRYFEKLIADGYIEPREIKEVSNEIYISLTSFMTRYDIKDDFLSSSQYSQPLDSLNGAETLDDIIAWFKGLIAAMYEYMSVRQLKVMRPEIKELQAYITEHIDENITLEKAAEITKISKSYLSTLFKNETGVNFTDYVNRSKMARAKVLIQQGYKIYEAAQLVGMSDISYFSKLFKRYIGVSPSKLSRVIQ